VHALRLQVHDFSANGRYTLHFDWNDACLPPAQRARAIQHFEQILDACLEDPDTRISRVRVLTEGDLEALAVLRDDGARPLPSRTVVELFEAQAEATPDRIALRQGAASVTFDQLRRRSHALAARLVERGVQPEDRVAILSRRSIDTVTAILATLRAGGAFVPVDPSYPDTRQEQLLDDCGARLLLMTRDRVAEYGRLMPEGMDALVIAQETEKAETSSADRRLPASQLGHLAYMIYTSGSTGQPKGVLIEHGGLADYLQWAERIYLRGEKFTLPLFTSLSFDLTITSLFLPLITGGTLEIYPEPEGSVDSALLDVAASNSVDFIKLTPSHLSVLRQLDLRTSKLRRVVVGGEDFKTHLAQSVSAQLEERTAGTQATLAEIYNEYGPTEAVVACAVHRYDGDRDTGSSVPIGLPGDHVELEILNQERTPVPAGVPGELWISRYGLARGYQGNQELTAERFQPRPDTGKKRYRTGDLCRLNERGVLEYLGRIDRQLKISGLRVEPGEIETTLLSHPAIEQCVVLARDHGRAAATRGEDVDYCQRCGLPSNYPRATFDQEGVCNVCHAYDAVKERAQAYFKTEDDLRRIFEERRTLEEERDSERRYDCMMLLSGGKDSTYALCQLVEMGLSVLAFTLDNGYISEGAKDNMRRVTEQLGVPLELASTPAMNDIFRDSLNRFSNVCHGCFKTIYTLSTNRAKELGIPIIVTGLSRGQMFETRLTEELFRDGRFTADEVDAAVLAARKVYHRVNDQVFRSLDVQLFQDDSIFEQVQFVDFYRYNNAGLDEVLSYLDTRVPWVRPEDTGRSTNCLINDIGIYVHKKERQFHNYALPYSWDVRLGHKTRDQALDELNDEIDLDHVHRTLLEIGYQDPTSRGDGGRRALEGFYVVKSGSAVSESELRDFLGQRLPSPLVPSFLCPVDAIPLTPNGKVDEAALPRPIDEPESTVYVAPQGPVEQYLAELWQQELGLERVGAQSNFFELGGTSLGAMEVMVRLCQEFDIRLELETLFEKPTVRELAALAEEIILQDVSGMSVAEQKLLLGD
jgi:amino acid adenylation domain-containing protein